MIKRAAIVAIPCAIMLVVQMLAAVSGGPFASLGIQPRDVGQVHTILTAPWVHGDFAHLANNLWAFLIFGSLVMLNGARAFVLTSLIIILFGGGLLWLFGRDASHIGASLWVFGLWSFVIAQAWFDRSVRTILIALAVLLLYGGVAWGLLPTGGRVSFEGHIAGAVAGVMAAWLLARFERRRRLMPPARDDAVKFWS